MMPDSSTFTPGEVAELFHVKSKTVSRWAAEGKLPYFRTPGGHRRFHREDVEALLERSGGRSQWQQET